MSLIVAGIGLNPIRSHYFSQPEADLDCDFMSSIITGLRNPFQYFCRFTQVIVCCSICWARELKSYCDIELKSYCDIFCGRKISAAKKSIFNRKHDDN